MSAALNKEGSVRRNLIFALLTAVVILFLAEGVARGAMAVLGWDFKVSLLADPPKYPVVCEAGDLVSTCPDSGYDYDKLREQLFFAEPYGQRIVVIGESFVYGLGIEMHEAWPARLQHHLGENYEVLNFGRCGSYATSLVPVLEGALKLKPTAVVLAIGNNEHTMTSFYTGLAGRYPLLVYDFTRFLGQFSLFKLMSKGIGLAARPVEGIYDKPGELVNEQDVLIYAARRRPPDLSAFPERLADGRVTSALEREQRLKERLFFARLEDMVAKIEAAGAIAVLATLPNQLTSKTQLSGIHGENTGEIVEAHRRILPYIHLPPPGDGSLPTMHGLNVSQGVATAEAALLVNDKLAHAHFAHGMSLLYSGESKKAAVALRKAMDWDLVPENTPALNDVVRKVAQSTGAHLIELEPLADKHILQWRAFFKDSVHVNAQGADEIGAVVAASLKPVLETSDP